MSIKSVLIPRLAAAITSPRTRAFRRAVAEAKRVVLRRPYTVTAYLRVGDPYSHVLAQVLTSFAARFDVELRLRAVFELPEEMVPDPENLKAWAHRDASSIAGLYDLASPGPIRDSNAARDATLRLAEVSGEGPDAAWQVFASYAEGSAPQPTDREGAERALADGERELAAGHYNSAMLHFGGEWYWGIDRLNHLERRLTASGRRRGEGEETAFDRRLRFLESAAPTLFEAPPLTLYWSARSPYSYLVVTRAVELADAFGVALDIRPVLPMVMRNLSVPRAKRFYILLDGKREAELLGIPYGRVCDPLGEAVERCYAVFDLARKRGREVQWALAFSTAVWSEGINAASDRGLSEIARRAGLDPDDCIAAAPNEDWRDWAELHRQEMLAGGFWGVPTLRFGDTWVWGQDRLWVIEGAMRRWSENKIGSPSAADSNIEGETLEPVDD